MKWAFRVDRMIREGRMKTDPTMNYLVIALWKIASYANRGVVINISGDDLMN